INRHTPRGGNLLSVRDVLTNHTTTSSVEIILTHYQNCFTLSANGGMGVALHLDDTDTLVSLRLTSAYGDSRLQRTASPLVGPGPSDLSRQYSRQLALWKSY